MQSGQVEGPHFFTQIPFEYKGKEIIIRAKINGVEGVFMLDTGAPNVLSKAFQKKLGLKAILKQKVTDSQNQSQREDFVRLDIVEIGDLRIKNTVAVVIDFTASKEIACYGLDGLIGANLLRKAYVQIDYLQEQLTLTDRYERLKLPPNAISIPFKPSTQGTPHLQLRFGKTLLKNLKLDTGSSGWIGINARHAKKAKANWPRHRKIGYSSSGIYGAHKDSLMLYLTDSIWLHKAPFTNTILRSTQSSSNLIGNRFFEAYVLTIDWVSNRMLLVPQADYQFKPPKSYGFDMRYGANSLIISNVMEGSKAMALGFEPDDIVLQIDDRDYRGISHEEYCLRRLGEGLQPQREKIVVKLRKKGSDREMEVELEQFMMFMQ